MIIADVNGGVQRLLQKLHKLELLRAKFKLEFGNGR